MHRARPPVRRIVLVLLGAATLFTSTACGARWDADQKAEVAARQAGRGAGAEIASDEVAASGESSTDGSSTAASGDTGGTGGGGAGGTTGGSGGEGTPGASGPSPCAAKSTAPGVTDKEIRLGSISTLSGAVPGLGASAQAAAQAYVAYRNATGGVCGRQLVLKTGDDGMDNARHRAITTQMSSEVLGLIGGLGGGDAGSGEVVAAKGMPAVTTPISDGFQNASTVFDMNPPFENVNAPIGKYKFLHSQGVRTAALVYIAVEQTRSEINKQRPQMEASGIKVVHTQELPLSTLSFDSAARGVANSKADYLFFVSEAGQSASMAQSMRDTGYKLKFEEYLVAYGSNFIELAGDAANGTSTWIRTLPNEERGNAEQAAFLQWMDRTAPGTVTDTFAADSWTGAKAFIDALAALPGPITREALLAQLRGTKTYDAGGMMGAIQLGAKRNNGCFIGMIVDGGKWRRLTPAKGHLC
jgi:ABC-type branched-subunit amino acid transport system substrate-binding protein